VTETMCRVVLVIGFATVALGACASDTSKLEVGDCVKVEAGFTLSGDAEAIACDEVQLFTDNYRVTAVGSESEMDASCQPPDLIIVDGDNAACLSQ